MTPELLNLLEICSSTNNRLGPKTQKKFYKAVSNFYDFSNPKTMNFAVYRQSSSQGNSILDIFDLSMLTLD